MKRSWLNFFVLVIFFVPFFGVVVAEGGGARVDRYNVRWSTQSENSADSMPCVGGDMGLNVWIENDELLFYVGREGCRDENGSLLKMGRVRVAISPSPFAKGAKFSQELKLREGLVEIRAAVPEKNSATIRIWVEVDRPIVHA